jgi:Pyruvate/2-oxoacid:ferredoxin oxidoreductase delta subunit
LAKLIEAYKKAYDTKKGILKLTFPFARAITVDRLIEPKSTVHTYDQIQTYIYKYDPISVSTCYCRHKAFLLGEDTHDVPMEACIQFGFGAQFAIERMNARAITKKEARDLLDQVEKAGLVHTGYNTSEDISFICNCDRWHCTILKLVLAQSKPGLIFNSGFQPGADPDMCAACGTCITRCPSGARTMNENNFPEIDPDRCFGCAVCATGCPSKAIKMVNKPGFPEPPKDMKALSRAIAASVKL